MYSPSKLGMGLASAKLTSRPGSDAAPRPPRVTLTTGTARGVSGAQSAANDSAAPSGGGAGGGSANGAAERGPTPAGRGSAGRELATVPADDDFLAEIAGLADSFPECACYARLACTLDDVANILPKPCALRANPHAEVVRRPPV